MMNKMVVVHAKYISWKGCFDMIAAASDFMVSDGMRCT